jgi:hypothetical protein
MSVNLQKVLQLNKNSAGGGIRARDLTISYRLLDYESYALTKLSYPGTAWRRKARWIFAVLNII